MKSHRVLLFAVAALSWIACNKKTDDTSAPNGSGPTVALAAPSAAASSASASTVPTKIRMASTA